MLLYRLLAPRGQPHDLKYCAEAAIQSVRLYSTLLDEKSININVGRTLDWIEGVSNAPSGLH